MSALSRKSVAQFVFCGHKKSSADRFGQPFRNPNTPGRESGITAFNNTHIDDCARRFFLVLHPTPGKAARILRKK
jgi:hypothetical protein